MRVLKYTLKNFKLDFNYLEECPMYRCLPCTYGYEIDTKGCQTCTCRKGPGCEYSLAKIISFN